MFTRSGLAKAMAGCLVIVGAFGLVAHADELAQNQDSVKPNEATLRTVGSARLIAFYEPGNGDCGLNAVIWNVADESGNSPTRVRVSLKANQAAYIDSADNKSIRLECGDSADTLKIIDDTLVAGE